ncbi:hypothetical protein LIER_22577 [Lithospermum erythrorhizon]|uniref:Uncharacterized protein n=1 Tax=Lithospermum erythrorhizon TaxID=34254 RepID=A0AAV3QXT1_LITER
MVGEGVKVYRELVKAVKKHIGNEDHKTHFTHFIKQEFTNGGQSKDVSFIQQNLKLAKDYTFLLNSVHHQKDLLFSYNIAVDRTEEMAKTLGKSAASVGLQLPEAYKP